MRRGTLVEIVTTVASESVAVEIARRLVRDGLAACGNVSRCRSVYRWRGKIEEEEEFEIRLKTTAAHAAEAERALRAIHPYEVPAIVRLPVLAAAADYVAWVEESVRPSADPGEPAP